MGVKEIRVINDFSHYKNLSHRKTGFQNRFFIGKNKDGFYALDSRLIDMQKMGKKNTPLYKRSINFINDSTNILNMKKEKSKKAFSRQVTGTYLNATHLQKVLHLIRL